jgi:catechol 2,3-dioxygenase-like lactoylglutathione lyase family enzyme
LGEAALRLLLGKPAALSMFSLQVRNDPKPQELDMSTTEMPSQVASDSATSRAIEMKLEIVVIPVSDVDRAKRFYVGLGWRLDADVAKDDGFRVVQVTPPGSSCSVIFGAKITSAVPGSAQGLHLIVSDVEAARAVLIARGADVSEVFHDAAGVFHRADHDNRLSGPDPQRASYASFASFSDPDGNGWLFQEITTRLPGRIETDAVTFTSATELTAALKRAAAAHGDHEKRLGGQDPEWADWYGDYIMREQTGKPLPT